jgi:TonB family protein
MDGRERMDGSEEPTTWGTRLRRQTKRPPARFILASVGLHLFVVGALYAAGMRVPRLPEFEQFKVNLVSPPPQVQGPPEPVQTTTPVVTPEPPKPEPPKPEPPKPEPPKPEPPKPKPEPPKAQPEPRPEPARPQTQAARSQPVERKPEPKPATGPDPKPVATGGENINVVQDGRDFQYPDYLENIMIQLTRYFRWSGPANLEAEVVFHINRDGSVGGIRIVRRSGTFQFDAQASNAVEQAGRAKAFGPLPADWQRDRLHISYTFMPPR